MNSNRLLLVLASTISCCLLVFSFFFARNFVGADTVSGNVLQTVDLSSEVNLRADSLILESFGQDLGYVHRLTYKNGLFGRSYLNLSGFETEAMPCHSRGIQFSLNSKSICLTGNVGVHSMNLQIITVSSKLAPVKYEMDGILRENVTSDLPLFKFVDDGVEVYNRDYDSDPLTKAIKDTYLRNSSGNFVFDKKEHIEYDNQSSN